MFRQRMTGIVEGLYYLASEADQEIEKEKEKLLTSVNQEKHFKDQYSNMLKIYEDLKNSTPEKAEREQIKLLRKELDALKRRHREFSISAKEKEEVWRNYSAGILKCIDRCTCQKEAEEYRISAPPTGLDFDYYDNLFENSGRQPARSSSASPVTPSAPSPTKRATPGILRASKLRRNRPAAKTTVYVEDTPPKDQTRPYETNHTNVTKSPNITILNQKPSGRNKGGSQIRTCVRTAVIPPYTSPPRPKTPPPHLVAAEEIRQLLGPPPPYTPTPTPGEGVPPGSSTMVPARSISAPSPPSPPSRQQFLDPDRRPDRLLLSDIVVTTPSLSLIPPPLPATTAAAPETTPSNSSPQKRKAQFSILTECPTAAGGRLQLSEEELGFSLPSTQLAPVVAIQRSDQDGDEEDVDITGMEEEEEVETRVNGSRENGNGERAEEVQQAGGEEEEGKEKEEENEGDGVEVKKESTSTEATGPQAKSNWKHVKPPVRKKEDRAKLAATTCHACYGYYKAAGLDDDAIADAIGDASRHRHQHGLPPSTPPSFWAMEIPDDEPPLEPVTQRKRRKVNKYLRNKPFT